MRSSCASWSLGIRVTCCFGGKFRNAYFQYENVCSDRDLVFSRDPVGKSMWKKKWMLGRCYVYSFKFYRWNWNTCEVYNLTLWGIYLEKYLCIQQPKGHWCRVEILKCYTLYTRYWPTLSLASSSWLVYFLLSCFHCWWSLWEVEIRKGQICRSPH